ncbi:uncharacterized protein LOC126735945 isoform X2 [Anthonomus grandis grandis]|uniref:uncharacterized protein LOC126735945 isoform X2 n=1 Tax=Anthonomus grandis grandis TaxID=2921223 RepID=UPI002165A742|nr:uncharacterized protein LOC126735945 isoform X2 [Anthonomus grandis grandis]
MDINKLRKPKDMNMGRARSTLSVSDVDYYLNLPVSCPTSPAAASTLTLTPGRLRNIDQDMENIRVSRQDNPFIQRVIASRESLLDSSAEEESDNVTLMSKELSLDLELDPLSLPEMHEHMIRSPPPTCWPRTPNFRAFDFPNKEDTLQQTKEKSKSTDIKPKHSSWHDGSESSVKSFKAHYYHDKFSLLASSSLRPSSAEDNMRLMGED